MTDPVSLGVWAALSLAKGLSDKSESERQRRMEATVAQWSPWTGIKPERVKNPNPSHPAMQAALIAAKMFEKKDIESPKESNHTSPTGPYLTEAEYPKQKDFSLFSMDDWPEVPKPQYPLGYPTTQYPGKFEDFSFPWLEPYGPKK